MFCCATTLFSPLFLSTLHFVFNQTKFCRSSFNIRLLCERERKCSIKFTIFHLCSQKVLLIFLFTPIYRITASILLICILWLVICYTVYSFVFTSPFTDHHFFVFLFHKKKFVPFFWIRGLIPLSVKREGM